MTAWRVTLTAPNPNGTTHWYNHVVVADHVGKMLADVEALAGNDKTVETIVKCDGEVRIVKENS